MLIAGGVLGVTSDLASLAPLVGFQAVIFVGLVSFTPLFGASIFTENGGVFETFLTIFGIEIRLYATTVESVSRDYRSLSLAR